MTRIILAGLLALLLTVPASAQRGLDLNRLDRFFDQEANVEINLQGVMLRLVAEATRADEPEFAAMVEGLRGVFVRQYPLEAARGNLGGDIRSLARSFESDGWETLVRVREEGEDVYIYLLPTGDVIDGLILMALNEEEGDATFVSIEGVIDPAQIGRLGRTFGVDQMENVGG